MTNDDITTYAPARPTRTFEGCARGGHRHRRSHHDGVPPPQATPVLELHGRVTATKLVPFPLLTSIAVDARKVQTTMVLNRCQVAGIVVGKRVSRPCPGISRAGFPSSRRSTDRRTLPTRQKPRRDKRRETVYRDSPAPHCPPAGLKGGWSPHLPSQEIPAEPPQAALLTGHHQNKQERG